MCSLAWPGARVAHTPSAAGVEWSDVLTQRSAAWCANLRLQGICTVADTVRPVQFRGNAVVASKAKLKVVVTGNRRKLQNRAASARFRARAKAKETEVRCAQPTESPHATIHCMPAHVRDRDSAIPAVTTRCAWSTDVVGFAAWRRAPRVMTADGGG